MDSPIFKAKYQKYKYKVKLWEKNFKKIHGRIPSKHDIREAHISVRDAYKMYYKLKSSFLEDTLNDIFEEDGFDVSQNSSENDTTVPLSSSVSSFLADMSLVLPNTNEISNSNSNFSNLHEISPTALTNFKNVDENHVITTFEAEQIENININAWGAELNKKTIKTSQPDKSSSSSQELRKAMSEKLFRSSSFAKRNPRKSFSRSSSHVSNSSQSGSQQGTMLSQKETLPDLETILLQKSQQQEVTTATKSTIQLNPNNSHLTNVNIDQNWLSRCSQDSSISDSTAYFNEPTVETTKKYGLSNINVDALSELNVKKVVYTQNTYDRNDLSDCFSDEVIENSEDESNFKNTRHILKKRKIFDTLPKQRDKSQSITIPTKAIVLSTNILEKLPETISHLPMEHPSQQQLMPSFESPSVIIESPVSPLRKKNVRSKKTASELSSVSKESKQPSTRKKPVKKSSTKTVVKPTPAMARRSRRQTVQNCEYYEETSDIEDPFANDDSNDDPDYEENKDKQKHSNEDSDVETEIIKPSKTKMPKKIVKKKQAENEDNEDTEMEQYIPEFTDTAINIPRINMSELQKNSELFDKYVNDIGEAKSVSSQLTDKKRMTNDVDIPTKRDLERVKLEKKVASGKLNENFVRINIQKKKFSRGHKKVNFSKYKKGLWKKNKAAAALAGPEMDMGGCDGGFLVCFQCGQQGHFAQNCKVQSDRLLPLTDEIEESSFATMEEVEQMARHKAAMAHSSKPNSLPLYPNSAITSAPDSMDVELDKDYSTHLLNDSTKEQNPLNTSSSYIGHKIPEEFLKLTGFKDVNVANSDSIEPLYSLKENGDVIDTPAEVFAALNLFGHTKFRHGQDLAVMRILSGQSTLVTLSTGTGKSLCYQLPAYLYRKRRQCITLVISPLVSLMEDQIQDMPHFLNARCLHSNQTKSIRTKTIDAIKAGEVDILLVSPEAIVSGEKSTGFGSLLRDLPPIAFVCIDEAHCMSQWSHNFRPSYLMICRVLKENLKVRTVLGLTATATVATRESIVRHLSIPDGLAGVISDIPLPNNLLLTVSKDENRDIALIQLLKGNKFSKFQSIIIYCTRRDECERVAKYIRICFQEEEQRLAAETNPTTSRKRKRTKRIVEFYHAGMVASRRKTIQNDFMQGNLKIVVATIAFGMGINKSDIRAVIHYNMPMTFEGYVQEVGRAGRDGEVSHCHLFLDKNCNDLVELRRHIYTNSIGRGVIRKLLGKVFVPCACRKISQKTEHGLDITAVQNISWSDDFYAKEETQKKPRVCSGHEVCFSVEGTVQALDVPEENIETLLCYIELHEQRYIQVLSKAFCMCKVMSYSGAEGIKQAAKKCVPLAMAIALDLKKGISHNDSTVIEFPVVDIAAAIGWNSGIVKYHLKNLEWTTGANDVPKRSTLSVEFFDLGFRVKSPGDLSDNELDETLDLLCSRVEAQEKQQLFLLQNVFNGLSAVAFKSYANATDDEDPDSTIKEHSNKLKCLIRDYFQRKETKNIDELMQIVTEDDAFNEDQVVRDVHTMMSRYPENNFTGRALARIFHGISSPVYPAVVWSRCKFWRVHTKYDFNRIVTLSNSVIIKMRT